MQNLDIIINFYKVCKLSSAIFIISPEHSTGGTVYPLTEKQDGGCSGELYLSTEQLTVMTSDMSSTDFSN